MFEHLHDRAAELIPELHRWNDGRGITLADWANAVGRYDYAIAYASVFWPDFFLHDDCVFRLDPKAENYAEWMSSLKGDRSKVEAMINHLHILDMFTSEGFEPTPQVVVHVASVLKDMWLCKLQRDFPERQFKVEIHDGQPDDLLTYEITFFQDRAGPQTRFVRLHPEITLTNPNVDEVCDFTSLLIRIRDRSDRGVNIEFPSYLSYSKSDESFFFMRDLASKLIASENRGHWLYDVQESPLLRDFMARNPHVNPNWDARHYLVVTDNDVIDVIAWEQPIISERTDSVRGWIRPGEERSAPPGWDGTPRSDDSL
jgi:hypothetical protein